jgi:hypothetical protein
MPLEDITVQDVEEGMQKLHNKPWGKSVMLQVVKEHNPAVYDEYMKEKKRKATENAKKWSQENQEKVKANRQKYNQKEGLCECGKKYKEKNKARHLKSTYHQKRIAMIK